MPTDFLPAIRPQRAAWNKGRIVGQKYPLQPRHVWSIRVHLEMANTPRDIALFNLADAAVTGALDHKSRDDRRRLSLVEPLPRQSASLDPTIRPNPARLGHIDRAGTERFRYPFDAPNQGRPGLQEAGELCAVQLLLGHTKMDSTVRYLGADFDDALAISEAIDL